MHRVLITCAAPVWELLRVVDALLCGPEMTGCLCEHPHITLEVGSRRHDIRDAMVLWMTPPHFMRIPDTLPRLMRLERPTRSQE